VHARLVALTIRRILPWPLALGIGALLLTSVLRSGSAPWLATGEEALLRAARRLDAWGISLVFAWPLLVARSGLLGATRRNEWLAPAPAAGAALAHLAGVLVAVLAVVSGTALCAELAAGSAPHGWQTMRRFATPAGALFPGRPVHWEEPGLAHDDGGALRLRIAVTVAPGSGPAATLRFEARTRTESASVEERVAARTHIDLDLDHLERDGQPLVLELASVGQGALPVLLPDGLQELRPIDSERAQSLELALRAAGTLAVACALALGLAGWMRPALAAVLAIALVLVPLQLGPGARWFPAGDLARAWGDVAAGLAPASLPWSAWAGALAVVAAAGALHGLALRTRPEAP